jgi:hypothetical protein
MIAVLLQYVYLPYIQVSTSRLPSPRMLTVGMLLSHDCCQPDSPCSSILSAITCYLSHVSPSLIAFANVAAFVASTGRLLAGLGIFFTRGFFAFVVTASIADFTALKDVDFVPADQNQYRLFIIVQSSYSCHDLVVLISRPSLLPSFVLSEPSLLLLKLLWVWKRRKQLRPLLQSPS